MKILKVKSLKKMEHVLVCPARMRWPDFDISAHFRPQGDRVAVLSHVRCWWNVSGLGHLRALLTGSLEQNVGGGRHPGALGCF